MIYHPSSSIKLSLQVALPKLKQTTHSSDAVVILRQDDFCVPIIQADDCFVCIEKPPFLRIDAADATELTLERILRSQLIERKGETDSKRPQSVSNITELKQTHQLDANTSGVFLYAKTKVAAGEASRQFAERSARKTYLAIVHGHVDIQRLAGDISQLDKEAGAESVNSNNCLRVEAYIQEINHHRCETVHVPADTRGLPAGRGHAQKAVTLLSPLAHLHIFEAQLPVTLVRLDPETGRRHQLRVHCASIGHAIVGDWEYESIRTQVLVKHGGRMFLHAFQLEMTFPDTGLLDGSRKRNKRGKLVAEDAQSVHYVWRSRMPFCNVLDGSSISALEKLF